MPDQYDIVHGTEIESVGSTGSATGRVYTRDGTEYRLSHKNLLIALEGVEFKIEKKAKYNHLVPVGQYAYRVTDLKGKVVAEWLEHPRYAYLLAGGGTVRHFLYADGATDECRLIVDSVGLEDYQVLHMCGKPQGLRCVRNAEGGMLVSMPAKSND